VEAALKRLGASDNHLTLAQDRDTLADETGLSVHPWPGALALAADAQKRRPAEQDEAALALPEGDRTSAQARKDWRTELEAIAPERLVFAAAHPLAGTRWLASEDVVEIHCATAV
jgi:hypothetical protein